MDKQLKILGDGQIWDLRGILSTAPQKTFEDLFSGRALGEMARNNRIFAQFKERSKITGLSVTRALLSDNPQAMKAATLLLQGLAKNAAAGIDALTQGRGFKPNRSNQEKNYWRNLNTIFIGGGVSEGTTGRLLVRSIKRYLSEKGLLDLEVYQAKFPGKEAGFIGGLINILKSICREGKKKGLKQIAGIGLDLGREDIGAGLLVINPKVEKIVLPQRNSSWIFQHCVQTPHPARLKVFLDSRRDYTEEERAMGKHIRTAILKEMVDLIILARTKAQESGLESSQNIVVAVPGRASGGFILDSTDYLPFFRKRDRFNFARALERLLSKSGIKDCCIHIINDGIAAGIANIYFSKVKQGKFAFFGVGSGLGGCVGLLNETF